MSDNDVDQFSGYRVAYHAPDAEPRVVAESTMLSLARHSAKEWARRLHTAGQPGTVVVTAAARSKPIATFVVSSNGHEVR